MGKNTEPAHILSGGLRGSSGRAERLEAELKANLKKRKEQARARSKTGTAAPPPPEDGGKEK